MRITLLSLSSATIAAFLLSLTGAAAQDPERIFLNEHLERTTGRKATFYRIWEGMEGQYFIGRTYAMDGKLKAEGRYLDQQLTIEHGHFTYYHANGKVESSGDYTDGLKSGVWERFDAWGRPLAEKVYDPEPLADIVYTRAQTMPSYPGGDKELVRYIRGRVAGSEGQRMKAQVTASFIVEKNGALTEVKVVKGQDPFIDEKVVDALRSTPAWDPGREKGRPVRVQMQLPVEF
ncbi:MAG TPA: energy transducer TonB [Flavobacteriales bacterium]|nr:energy transducer TonB [Flavobacteriales bacterium]HMR26330.1 energy transducer TonB [Flavobacteriales bacterium]